MLHLLPHSHTQEIRSEYKRRFLSLVFYMLALIMLVAAVALAPSFIMIHAHKATLEAEALKSNVQIDPAVEARVQAFEAIVTDGKQYTKTGQGIRALAITELLSTKTAGIILTQITIDTDEGIALRGTATTRAALTGFVKSLEVAGYDVADIPASTFTLDKNLPFTISLKNKLP